MTDLNYPVVSLINRHENLAGLCFLLFWVSCIVTYALQETSIFAPDNEWLEDSFLFGAPFVRQRFSLVVWWSLADSLRGGARVFLVEGNYWRMMDKSKNNNNF